MSRYLLDTNVPSEIIRQRADVKVDFWVRSQDDETLYLSAITIGELRKGLAIHPEGKRRDQIEEWLEADLIPAFTDRILPVTQLIAERRLQNGGVCLVECARCGAGRLEWPTV